MTIEELREKVRLHGLWLAGDPIGQRADLRGADLRGAYLQGADLRGAYLQGAYLRVAYLQRADLRGADLRGADLQGAHLRGADLQRADLRVAYLQGAHLRGADLQRADLRVAYLQGADLRGAYLQGADLQRADLRGADLRVADLRGADLQGAYLQGADLQRADLRGADLQGDQVKALLHAVSIVPQEGPFWVFKAVRCKSTHKVVILQMEVPATAQRLGGLVGRKCRVSEAIVLGATWPDGKPFDGEMVSDRDESFAYRVGATVTPDSFDPNAAEECSHGIHVFMNRLEAIGYLAPSTAREMISAMLPKKAAE